MKKKTNRSTWKTKKYFNLIEEKEGYLEIPRGFIGSLIRFCRENKIEFEFHDERIKQDHVKFSSKLNLRPYQIPATEAASVKNFGIISAPPGSGKTVIGLKIIADKKQPALILVHRRQLFEQWIERIQGFLGIPKNKIGRIGSGNKMQSAKKTSNRKDITVAMIQSLGKLIEKEPLDFVNSFGTIVIDECHHVPAQTYSNIIAKLFPYYQYGLTATPFRKQTNDKIISAYLGEIIANIKPSDIEAYKRPKLIVRKTSLDIPFNPKTDPFEVLSKVLVHDSARNKLLIKDIIGELDEGKKVVIITERKEHIDILNQFLKQSFETLTLSGKDSETNRKLKWDALKSGNYQALITTGQYFGEGSDLDNATCLFLAYPFAFKGKLIQYIGRVQRSKNTPVIYDYDDYKINYLHNLFLKRNAWYRNLDRQATLFDDVDSLEEHSTNTETIRKTISVPIEKLDFRYGAIAFVYEHPSNKMEIEFEIESKRLISKIAVSKDLEKINKEIIESVKFQYLQKRIIGRDYSGKRKMLLDLNELQEGKSSNILFDQEDELLETLLKNQKIKHYRQLRYLSSRHEGTIVKLRFVLNPFSFVFLLQGSKRYHIILETLDTEEATYIWYFEKNKISLRQNLEIINRHLTLIRNKGRQEFLKNPPENFSRIIHDYSDERKGFIIWKDQLEERLM
ncbi:MAG: DEAD/DEAH box helicase [Bacteroidota bacterium]|nr:DEAD/DEAH box helicase [Bacteroidota bacterium]